MPLHFLVDVLAGCLRRGCNAAAVHAASAKRGLLPSVFLSNCILHGYLEDSRLSDARKLFDGMPKRNVVSWSMLLSGYSRTGNVHSTILVFKDMVKNSSLGDQPNAVTFGTLLACCSKGGNVAAGLQLHCYAIKLGACSTVFVIGTLIDMYAKCGLVTSSWKVFNLADVKDIVCWTTMISCLVNSEGGPYQDDVVYLFKEMMLLQVWPVGMTFCSTFRAFSGGEELGAGKQVHGCMIKLGIEFDRPLWTALMSMYAQCGAIHEICMLAGLVEHDVVSLTVLLAAFTQNGCAGEALYVFRRMLPNKMAFDHFALTSVIDACSSSGLLATGKEVHCYVLRHGFVPDVSLGNAIISLYGRCGDVEGAKSAFHVSREKDVISWTTLLTSYAQNRYSTDALLLFKQMVTKGLDSPSFCITGALQCCSSTTNLFMGHQIHTRIVKKGISHYKSVESALITVYAKCGCLEDAFRVFSFSVFRSTNTWNALITGLSQHGHHSKALEFFHEMQEEGAPPDDYTFIGVLVSCSRTGLVTEGCVYFKQMGIKYGLKPKMPHYACMVDLFGRAGKFGTALQFINAMPCEPGKLIWEALLGSCKLHGNLKLGEIAAEKLLENKAEDPSPFVSLSDLWASLDIWDGKARNRSMLDDQGARKATGKSWLGMNMFLQERVTIEESRTG